MNIHFEGDDDLRPGFRKLFDRHVERGRGQRIKFRLIAGGSNMETVKDFLDSCRRNRHDVNVLLIDSESAVSDTARSIQTLRRHRTWDAGVHCDDEQINFMVQAMEAWFVADPQALVAHFGNQINRNTLPNPQSAESIAPANLVAAIQRALPSRIRRRRSYGKVADGVKLLGLIDESAVSQHCPHFKRLMDFLDRRI